MANFHAYKMNDKVRSTFRHHPRLGDVGRCTDVREQPFKVTVRWGDGTESGESVSALEPA